MTSPYSLTFPAVVGLTTLQFDVFGNSYWFKSKQKCQYQFLRESAIIFLAVARVDLVSLPPRHVLLKATTSKVHLDDFNSCYINYRTNQTATLGCTSDLTEKIFSPIIKQKPYGMLPSGNKRACGEDAGKTYH